MSLKANDFFTNVAELLDFLEFDDSNRKKVLLKSHFMPLIPLRFAKKMEKNNPNCPLFLQFVPLVEELNLDPNFKEQPVEDNLFQLSGKLLQKYSSRSLILTTKACAMHCRYCFRKNFSYEVEKKGFDEELKILREKQNLQEVILSGGDPLSLDPKSLIQLLHSLEDLAHIKIIRFHTRTILSNPEKVTQDMLDFFQKTTKKIVFVIHSNHPNELDQDIIQTFAKLKAAKVTLLSQSVLLKGVNDNLETLKTLCWTLFESGVLPYYIHQLDRVQGGQHFEVDKKIGIDLIDQLRKSLPGYLVPRYVEEIPHQKSKTLIF